MAGFWRGEDPWTLGQWPWETFVWQHFDEWQDAYAWAVNLFEWHFPDNPEPPAVPAPAAHAVLPFAGLTVMGFTYLDWAIYYNQCTPLQWAEYMYRRSGGAYGRTLAEWVEYVEDATAHGLATAQVLTCLQRARLLLRTEAWRCVFHSAVVRCRTPDLGLGFREGSLTSVACDQVWV